MDAREAPIPLDALVDAELATLFLQRMIDGGRAYEGVYGAMRETVERLRAEGMADPEIAEHIGGAVADIVGQGRDTHPARLICKTLVRLSLSDEAP